MNYAQGVQNDRGPGLFISFEGGDGAGKSTQAQLLAQALAAQGRQVVLTHEPGDTELGAQLRQLLLHGPELDPRTEALLFATDRAHHVATVIRPALAAGKVVITDRYIDSSVAYQAGGHELDPQEIEQLSLWATAGLWPDVTFLLDVDPQAGRARFTSAPDRLERKPPQFHRRLREQFLTQAHKYPERFVVVAADAPVAQIHDQVLSRTAAMLATP